jgi:hypothetical protein
MACFGLVVMLMYNAWIVPVDWNSRTDIDSPTLSSNGAAGAAASPPPPQMKDIDVLVKDPMGRIVSRHTTTKNRLSDFLTPKNNDNNNNNTNTNNKVDNTSLSEAIQQRKEILSLLNDARVVADVAAIDILQLPTWSQVTALYGPKPIILGLERCATFREQVELQYRFVGVAGNFNSGTTAFGLSLQSNCRFPHRNETSSQLFSNDKVSNVHGMLSQVPWAKHKMAVYNKYNHTILPSVPKEHVLPVVLVRDPFYWMQSMCKQGYGVRWDHDPKKHCPNLIPNDVDQQRFGKRLSQSNNTSVRVWMGANPTVGPSWDSLIHYWNAWYESYWNASWPRLIIRFEDTLFHPQQVMKKVCHCAGGELIQPFHYLLDEAKWNHKHEQNNMITAMIRYGNDKGRYHNMTIDDIAFAQRTVNPQLMKAFQYNYPR